MIICRSCGTQNEPGATFCSSCNAFLEWMGEPAGPAAPAGPGAVQPQVQEPETSAPERRPPPPPSSLLVTMTQGADKVDAGGQIVFNLEVRNLGAVVDEVTFEILGDPAPWAGVEPPSLKLLPNSSGVATVRLRPPRDPRVRAGLVHFGVGVRSKESPASSLVQRGVVDVQPFTLIGVELAPRRARGRRRASFLVKARNDGNVPVDLDLSAADAEEVVAFEFHPATLRVEPGGSAIAKLTATTRDAFWLGLAQARQFQVEVEMNGQLVRTLDGTYLQGPLLPLWALPTLVGGAIVALIAVNTLLPLLGRVLPTPTPAGSIVIPPTSPPTSQPTGATESATPSVGPTATPVSWSSVDPLPRGTWGAAYALLPNGSVLIAGGTTGGTASSKSAGAVADAVLFDPQSRSWTTVAPMNERRAYPLAVLLGNGLVLVAGGSRDGLPLASAELYDPGARTWTETGPMTIAHTDFALVALADGRAMAIGGGKVAGNAAAIAVAEIYDPGSGSWARTGNLSAPRAYATATVVAGGRVLVTGGSNTYYQTSATRASATAELWDPTTNAWEPVASMSAPRYEHAAVLLPDGRVLVTGGWSAPIDPAVPQATTEVFDPGSLTWSGGPPMSEIRGQHRLVALSDGRVLAIAGSGAGNEPVASTEILDASLQGWAPAGQLSAATWWPSAVPLSGNRVLVAGGAADKDGTLATDAASVFAPPP